MTKELLKFIENNERQTERFYLNYSNAIIMANDLKQVLRDEDYKCPLIISKLPIHKGNLDQKNHSFKVKYISGNSFSNIVARYLYLLHEEHRRLEKEGAGDYEFKGDIQFNPLNNPQSGDNFLNLNIQEDGYRLNLSIIYLANEGIYLPQITRFKKENHLEGLVNRLGL